VEGLARRLRGALLSLWALIAALIVPFAAQARPAAPACRHAVFEGDGFVVCRYDPKTDVLRLASGTPAGPIGSLAGLQASLGGEANHVAFAMNAGMYGHDRRPLGLYVAEGKRLQPLNRGHGGGGNFYLLPNGVFWTDRHGSPHVDETSAFADLDVHPLWATQSGPLLVSGGAIHPAVSPNGTSLYVRNGVGVRGREAFFVISDGLVSFGRLARFLRDDLGCPDALYLDGSVSSLWAPDFGRRDDREGLGTFVLVLRRAAARGGAATP
jgi:uncharacterized protein YigE (DUF2233 family)